MNPEIAARAAHLQDIEDRARANMAEMGVDDAFVDRLVETFYSRIQAHPTLGPVFAARLDGRWPDHLAKMKRFWSAVAFKTGAYGGKPVQAHLTVENMEEPLFKEWLQLFAATLDDLGVSPDAKAWFMATAERIAKSLVLALFYNPALDDPARKTS